MSGWFAQRVRAKLETPTITRQTRKQRVRDAFRVLQHKCRPRVLQDAICLRVDPNHAIIIVIRERAPALCLCWRAIMRSARKKEHYIALVFLCHWRFARAKNYTRPIETPPLQHIFMPFERRVTCHMRVLGSRSIHAASRRRAYRATKHGAQRVETCWRRGRP